MRFPISIWCLVCLLGTGCSMQDKVEPAGDAYYKLYGNGTYQEAVAMEFTGNGGIYIIGNQYVRNQDSSAVVLIKVNAEGNQVWSGRYYGKGHTSSKSILILPDNNILVLASTRETGQAGGIPVLYRVNDKGELLNEFYIEEEKTAASARESSIPEGMVPGDNGDVFLAGNIRGSSGVSTASYIKRVDLASGNVLSKRVFSNSEMTEVKKIFRNGRALLVMGDTRQEIDEMKNRNIFAASFSPNLIEAGHKITGSANADAFKEAILSSLNEFVIISTEQIPGSAATRGVFRFMGRHSLGIRNTLYLNFSANEIPQAIAEDGEGNYLVAVNAIGERGSSNIIINKTNASGTPLWNSPKELGEGGSDKIAQVKIAGEYAYLLTTIDMQNENTLISLSKVKF